MGTQRTSRSEILRMQGPENNARCISTRVIIASTLCRPVCFFLDLRLLFILTLREPCASASFLCIYSRLNADGTGRDADWLGGIGLTATFQPVGRSLLSVCSLLLFLPFFFSFPFPGERTPSQWPYESENLNRVSHRPFAHSSRRVSRSLTISHVHDEIILNAAMFMCWNSESSMCFRILKDGYLPRCMVRSTWLCQALRIALRYFE